MIVSEAVPTGVAQGERGVFTQLYSRAEDGNHPVRVYDPGDSRKVYQVIRPEGPEVYTSTRSFLKGVRGTTRAHWTHDRYFKLGRWNPDPVPTQGYHLTVLDLFGPSGQDTSLTVTVPEPCLDPPAFTSDIAFSSTETSYAPAPVPPLSVSSTVSGIDLEHRAQEVAKLAFKTYGPWVRKAGFDDEEVLQEIYKGVLIRNKGKCPWDPAKSTFGTYVTLVARGVVFNYYRRETRRRRREQIGYTAIQDGDLCDIDVAECRNLTTAQAMWASDPNPVLEDPLDRLILYLNQHASDAQRALLVCLAILLREGHGRREITSRLGIKSSEYTELYRALRQHTEAWVEAGSL